MLRTKPKDKLLFVCPQMASFIKLDIEILSNFYDVDVNIYNWENKKKAPLFLIKQAVFLLFNTFKYKRIVISFGGYWALLPTLLGFIFRKKVYIVLHGTDCAIFPEIGYGSLQIKAVKWFCKWSYTFAYKLLPVSQSLVYTENMYYNENKGIKQGYSHFFPKVKTPYTVIPNGIKTESWINDGETIREEKSFISVVSSKPQIVRKGIDVILKLAEKRSDSKFYIVGFDD